MDDSLKRESESLARSWMQHDPEMLRTYLVSGVEDPRINIQSILARHAVVAAICGSQFQPLIEHELRFALVMNWAQTLFEQAGGTDDLQSVRHALQAGADNAEGIPVPGFARATFGLLPDRVSERLSIPNYIEDLLRLNPSDTLQAAAAEPVLSTFQALWSSALETAVPSELRVLELACGSANDYRFLHAYGLARLIDYTGLDLCEKNIANARAMFPGTRFAVGNAMAIEFPERAFEYCIVQDLFEHLSVEAMERAVEEICRVTRQGLCLGFFNLHEGDEHRVQPVAEYHWNQLSVSRLQRLLEKAGFEVLVLHLDTFLKWRFGCEQTHNKNAYTFFATRQQPQLER